MRKLRNACKCDNTKPKQLDDKYKTICCAECLEVISYEVPEKKKKKKQLEINL